MKTLIVFISFVTASTLAGIGVEDKNNVAMIFGLIFMVISVVTILSESDEFKKERR
jgi:hypothetical protein